MIRILLLSLLCLLTPLPRAFAWGPKGHDVVAYIAECNLSPQAAERVEQALGGYSMVYFANWLDSASHTPEFAYTKTWHYANIDEGFTYQTMDKNPNGDVVQAINQIVSDLKSNKLSPEEEKIKLKMLIHLVGDIHCPLHAGHLSDRGGNSVSIHFFDRETNLHSVWDSSLPEAAHKWSYTEWQRQIDRLPAEDVVPNESGTPIDWLQESFAVCQDIYRNTPAGSTVSYDYISTYTPVVEEQLRRGGHRLAGLLNDIYK